VSWRYDVVTTPASGGGDRRIWKIGKRERIGKIWNELRHFINAVYLNTGSSAPDQLLR